MSQVTPEQVAHIAQLARLSLSEEEAGGMQRDLERILDYVETLRELDTEGVEPTAHALRVATPMRKDEPTAPLPPELAIANAPQSSGTAFVVPKVVDEDAS